MKCLTVRPPWSYAIAALGKRIENRSWKTDWRGPLAIHAGAQWDGHRAARRVFELAGAYVLTTEMSAVVAVVDLVDVHQSVTCVRSPRERHLHQDGPFTCSPWATGLDVDGGVWHWELANVRRLAEPVPCKGTQRLWTLPDEVEAAVLAQIAQGAESAAVIVQASGHPDSTARPPAAPTSPPTPSPVITPGHRNEDT